MTEFFDRGLKAKDQATLETALTGAGLLPAVPGGVAYHFIGQIVTTPEVLDDDGTITTPAVSTADVHANIRLRSGQAAVEAALLAAFPDTAAPMKDDGATVSYVMDLRVPITCVWA